MNLKEYLSKRSRQVDRRLASLAAGSSLIDRAMRYSLTAGGKRLRPILVMCAAEICGGRAEDVLDAACALEYIHTYSLIHDDLPAMDDDDLRRGKPTSHKKFGEAAAILAGDALLTEAFGILAAAGCKKAFKPANVLRAVRILAAEAGKNGMIAGQVQDTLESDNWQKKSRATALKRLETIHLNKTAALIRASLEIGALLAGGQEEAISKLGLYGTFLGLAFQITDDVLDIEGDKKLLGKNGSDRDNNKLTYPALYGLSRSKKTAAELIIKAKAELAYFGKRGRILSALAEHVEKREY